MVTKFMVLISLAIKWACPAHPPLLDRILPFSHTLSPKSIHVVGPRPLTGNPGSVTEYDHQSQGHFEVKVSVWISIPKRVEELRPNGSLFIEILLI